MNSINLTGRLTKDPELKHTGSGKDVCSFTVAVQRPYSRDSVDFIPCVAWGKTAEHISAYFYKGNMIAITGSLQTREYEDKSGARRKAFEVIADSFSFIESKKAREEQTHEEAGPQSEYQEIDSDDEDLPF